MFTEKNKNIEKALLECKAIIEEQQRNRARTRPYFV